LIITHSDDSLELGFSYLAICCSARYLKSWRS